MPRFRVRYWATVYRDVTFDANNQKHAEQLAENFPEEDLPGQKEETGVEERDHLEVYPANCNEGES